MKKILLSFIVAILTVTRLSAQDVDWTWGTAKWNVEDGVTFDGIEDFNAKEGITLTYPNASEASLMMLHGIAVSCDLYVDDAAEAVQIGGSGRGNGIEDVVVSFSYHFIEGHKYRIETTGAMLTYTNIMTRVTDTLSVNNDSYKITFTITGPELVKTIDLESYQALRIIDEKGAEVDSAIVTYSLVDTQAITEALGIDDINEAYNYGLDSDGWYVDYEWYGPGYFDGWRDADGDYTRGFGSDNFHGGNSSLSSYRIQLNVTCDSIFYSFNDSWSEYDPDAPETVPGSGMEGEDAGVKARAAGSVPSMNTITWERTDEKGDIIKYTRRYRVDEGGDYKARFVFIANKKYVLLNATLHFLSVDDYDNLTTGVKDVPTPTNAPAIEGIYSLSGARLNSLQKGINIVKSADGSTRKVLVK